MKFVCWLTMAVFCASKWMHAIEEIEDDLLKQIAVSDQSQDSENLNATQNYPTMLIVDSW
jgi:hypothetical protein